jgi:predicted sugar kinase
MPPQDFLQKNLITELGLEDLPDDKKEELILKIGGLIQQNVLLRILSELGEKDKDEFDKVLAEGNDEKTLAFLQSKISNFDELVKEEVAKFKEEAIKRMQAVVSLSV